MNRRRHLSLTPAALALAALGLAGCAADGVDPDKPLADGVWEADSSPDEEGATGHIAVTVLGGQVAACEFMVYLPDGTPKDETYGLDSAGNIANQDYYDDAQRAVAAFEVYARELVEVGYPQDVDVVSGATWAHGQFTEAATLALEASQAAAAEAGA